MKILIHNIDAQRDEFLKIHAGDFYGGSDVGAICGVNPFRTPLQVWMEKTGKAKPTFESDQMYLGKELEPVVDKLFRKKTGFATMRPSQTWQNDEIPWMTVSPDVLIDESDPLESPKVEYSALGEIKTHKVYADQYWSNEMASDSAQCQLQWALGVSGGAYKHGYCIALIGGDADKFYYPRFEFDVELFQQMAGQVEKFRELVRKDTPPSAVAKDTDRIKELLLGKELKGHIDLTETHAELAERFIKAHAEHKALKDQAELLEEELKAIKNEILLAANGAAFATLGEREAKFFKVQNKGYTVKPFEYFNTKIK